MQFKTIGVETKQDFNEAKFEVTQLKHQAAFWIYILQFLFMYISWYTIGFH